MEKDKVVAIVCVRMSSERLPGKPLVSYHPGGKPNLECIVERVQTSRYNPKIVIATSTDKSDDTIAKWAEDKDVSLYRGSLENVVKRFDGALQKYCPEAGFIWRVMGDCPLVDIGLTDLRLDILDRSGADVITISPPEPTYAAQSSVWSRDAWNYCAKMSSGSLLPHPGEYIYENLGQFKTLHELGPESVYYQDIRTELDTEKDLEFFRQVWKGCDDHFWSSGNRGDAYNEFLHVLDTKSVLTWLSSQPHLTAINRDVPLKTKSTHLHGHSHARRFVCKNCSAVIGHRINDKLSLQCPSCGETRDYY